MHAGSSTLLRTIQIHLFTETKGKHTLGMLWQRVKPSNSRQSPQSQCHVDAIQPDLLTDLGSYEQLYLHPLIVL